MGRGHPSSSGSGGREGGGYQEGSSGWLDSWTFRQASHRPHRRRGKENCLNVIRGKKLLPAHPATSRLLRAESGDGMVWELEENIISASQHASMCMHGRKGKRTSIFGGRRHGVVMPHPLYLHFAWPSHRGGLLLPLKGKNRHHHHWGDTFWAGRRVQFGWCSGGRCLCAPPASGEGQC